MHFPGETFDHEDMGLFLDDICNVMLPEDVVIKTKFGSVPSLVVYGKEADVAAAISSANR